MRSSKFTILATAILIVCMGIASIYSSVYQKDTRQWQFQVYWVVLGLAVFFLVSNFNYRRFWDMTYFLYGLALFLLFLVFILGAIRLGAQRWLKIAWFNFQPSEIAKLCVVIFLARYFSSKAVNDVYPGVHKFGMMRSLVIPFIFVAIPAALIIEQPDLGSGIIVFLIFAAMLFLARVRLKYLGIISGCALLSLPFLWHFLKSYQKDRLLVFLNPNVDPLGAGYTVIQSKIAIGSGGFFGKGWLSGTQGQLHFLPESHTDFVFATFAEEWGFLGSALLLLLYYFLISEGIRIALRNQDRFGRMLAFGISMMLAIQVAVNIAMTLGLAPVVGLPLPLMSYGGSSVVTTFIALGILANIDKTRNVF